MISEKNQLEIRKFLKRLGIKSQAELEQFIRNNPDQKKLDLNVSIQLNNQEIVKIVDKIDLE